MCSAFRFVQREYIPPLLHSSGDRKEAAPQQRRNRNGATPQQSRDRNGAAPQPGMKRHGGESQ